MTVQCSECGKSYTRNDHLRRHADRAHKHIPEDAPRYICSWSNCNRSWLTTTELKKHVRDVHMKKYPCVIPEVLLKHDILPCDESFNRESQLWFHTCTVHNSLPRVFLRQMMFSIEATDGDQSHIPSKWPATHSSIICPFDECADIDFKERRTWIKHIRSHQDQKYQCKYCEISFPTYQMMMNHSYAAHSEERKAKQHEVRQRSIQKEREQTFFCPGCSKPYATRYGMKVHYQKYHAEEGPKCFSCEKCSFVTHLKQTLQRHMSKIHNGPLYPAKRPCDKISSEIEERVKKDELIKDERIKSELSDSTDEGSDLSSQPLDSINFTSVEVGIPGNTLVENIEKNERDCAKTLHKIVYKPKKRKIMTDSDNLEK